MASSPILITISRNRGTIINNILSRRAWERDMLRPSLSWEQQKGSGQTFAESFYIKPEIASLRNARKDSIK